MAVVILEGKITELSNAVVTNGQLTEYAFVTIGGKRVRKVCADNYLDSFLKVGAVVRLSCLTSAGRHLVFALQESNGELSQVDLAPLIFKTVVLFFCSIVLGAVAAVFALAITSSVSITAGVFGAMILGLPYLTCSGFFKARNALNGMAAPAEPAVA